MRLLSFAVFGVLGLSCAGSEESGPGNGGKGGTTAAPTGGSNPGGASATGGTGAVGPGTGGKATGGSVTATGGTSPGGGPPAQGGGGSANTGGASGGASPVAGAGTGGTVAGADGGGTTGTGGASAGASGSAGGSKSGGLGCSGSELLCEDFEGVAEGEVPTGGAWKPLDASCEFQASQFSMGVSTAQKNGGMKSLKVTNKHFAQCRLSAQFASTDDFWVRAYSFWETGLDISNRETLDIDMTPGHRTADDPAVRFGYRSKSPCEEYAGPQVTIIGLAGGEATGCGSREMPKGEWFCFEAHIQQSGPLTVSTYLNGEAISYQSTGKPMTTSIATEGAVTEKIDHIRLGIFSTGEAQGSVYIDDVAIAPTRLGCGG